MLLAHEEIERDIGHHGIPMSVATDPANAEKFGGAKNPTVDFAEKNLAMRRDAYYKAADANAKEPVSRAGHLWGVELTE